MPHGFDLLYRFVVQWQVGIWFDKLGRNRQHIINCGCHLSILIAGGTRIVPITLDLKFEYLIQRVAIKNVVVFLKTSLSQERLPAWFENRIIFHTLTHRSGYWEYINPLRIDWILMMQKSCKINILYNSPNSYQNTGISISKRLNSNPNYATIVNWM